MQSVSATSEGPQTDVTQGDEKEPDACSDLPTVTWEEQQGALLGANRGSLWQWGLDGRSSQTEISEAESQDFSGSCPDIAQCIILQALRLEERASASNAVRWDFGSSCLLEWISPWAPLSLSSPMTQLIGHTTPVACLNDLFYILSTASHTPCKSMMKAVYTPEQLGLRSPEGEL